MPVIRKRQLTKEDFELQEACGKLPAHLHGRKDLFQTYL